MAKFKDTAGREWSITCDLPTVKRVRDAAKVDLFAADLMTVYGDLWKTIDVLTAAVEPQAKALGLTTEQFQAALNGEVLDAGFVAIVHAVAEWHGGKKGKTLIDAFNAMRRAQDAATHALVEKMDGFDVEAEVKKLLDQAQPPANNVANLPPAGTVPLPK